MKNHYPHAIISVNLRNDVQFVVNSFPCRHAIVTNVMDYGKHLCEFGVVLLTLWNELCLFLSYIYAVYIVFCVFLV